MKVCMIVPPRVDGNWIGREDKHSGVSQGEFVPYTAPLLYELIRKSIPGVELELIEAQRDNLTVDRVKSAVRKIDPKIVVSFLSWTHIPWDRACAELDYPTIAIILQQYIDHKEAVELYSLKSKYIVKEEIEMPVVHALREFRETGEIRKTKGFLIRTDSGLLDTGRFPPADISRFPMPAFDAFDPERYFKLRESNPAVPKRLVRTAHFNTMKGCLFKCAYCGQANRGERTRFQSPGQVVDQIEFFVKNYDVSNFMLYDNEFGVNIKRAKDICREIIRRGLAIRYTVNNRVELFDDELIALMAESGCENVRLGIETCDPLLQKYINKEIDLDKAKEKIEKLKEMGILVHLYFTPGLPGESKESLKMNAQFIAETEPETFSTGPLFLMPNSKIYNDLKANGKLIESDWSKYREMDRLCYVNESYRSMDEVLKAERYLRRKAHFYLFKKRLLRGKFDLRSFLRFTSIAGLIPRAVKMRFS